MAINSVAEILVKEIVGKNCIHSEDGDILRFRIERHLDAGDTVAVDFTGTRQWSYAFMLHTFGYLLKKISYDGMMKKVKMTGVPTGNAVSIASLAVQDMASRLNKGC